MVGLVKVNGSVQTTNILPVLIELVIVDMQSLLACKVAGQVVDPALVGLLEDVRLVCQPLLDFDTRPLPLFPQIF